MLSRIGWYLQPCSFLFVYVMMSYCILFPADFCGRLFYWQYIHKYADDNVAPMATALCQVIGYLWKLRISLYCMCFKAPKSKYLIVWHDSNYLNDCSAFSPSILGHVLALMMMILILRMERWILHVKLEIWSVFIGSIIVNLDSFVDIVFVSCGCFHL